MARVAAVVALVCVVLPQWGIASETGMAPGEILVRLRTEGPLATRAAGDSLERLHAELGVRGVRAVFGRAGDPTRALQRRSALARKDLPPLPDLSAVYRVELAPGVDPAAAAARYRADPHVVWAQPNFVATLDRVTNDPFLSSSGSWGQSFADLWGIHRVEAPAAWDVAQGEGVVVAVVDTGVDLAHPDMKDNVWVNPGEDLDGDGVIGDHERNGSDDDGNGLADDFHGFDFANSVDANGDGDFDDPDDVSDADPFDDVGHGSHVAGTVAAVADNGIGVAGVAPRARIMAVKGFAAEGGGATAEVLARGMVYAITNGARVINNSWSCGLRCPRNPLMEEVVAFANALGVVVVTSAGNRGDDVLFYSPENRRGTIVVGATEVEDDPTVFSNRGHLVDVMAPGGADPFGAPRVPSRAILSLRSSGAGEAATGLGAFVVGEDYLRWSGTSMSCPHVAGVAALVLSRRPELTPDEVRGVIRASARDLGDAGHDRLHGAGLVDALGAVTREPPAAGGAIDSPEPAAVLRPQDGPVEIRGRLLGDVADAALSFGFGADPTHFEPIPLVEAQAATGERTLAIWDVDALEDGPYLLRLEVEARDGERIVEFAPISLERNAPIAFSSGGPAAQAPIVSGRTVVWQSLQPVEPREGEEEEPRLPEFDLFASDWEGGETWRVVGGPGHQYDARLAGARLAWRIEGETSRGVGTCAIRRRGDPCRDEVLAETSTETNDLFPTVAVSERALVFTERIGGIERLRGCAFRGERCRPIALPDSAARQSSPVLAEGRLHWLDWGGGLPGVQTCALRGDAACVPEAIAVDGPPPISFSGSAELLAWIFPAQNQPLFVCRIEEGRCAASLLAQDSDVTQRVSVSEHRLVWSGVGPGGDADVFFCEHDRHTGACPIQRISGSRANQRNPWIDGDRVVWEDDSVGPVVVRGVELPSLSRVYDRATRVGRPLWIVVRGEDPAGERPLLSAAFADGASLESRGARFRELGNGFGLFTWRPDAAAVGTHVVTFEARGAGDLVARRSAKIGVLPTR